MLEMNLSLIQRAKKVTSDFNFEGDVCSSKNCVTRAPLLYFIRSWVALSFKVCERVSESIRDPWHWVEPTGSSLRLCLLFVLCPFLKDDTQIYPIRMIQFKTWTRLKNHTMAIFGALCAKPTFALGGIIKTTFEQSIEKLAFVRSQIPKSQFKIRDSIWINYYPFPTTHTFTPEEFIVMQIFVIIHLV